MLRGAAFIALCAAALNGAAALAQSAATSAAFDSAASMPPIDEAPPADAAVPPAPLPEAQSAPATPAAAALPAGAGVLDSATVQRIVDRLVGLHLLASIGEGEDPALLAQAIRAFQSSIGISPTGMLDRDTIGRLSTP